MLNALPPVQAGALLVQPAGKIHFQGDAGEKKIAPKGATSPKLTSRNFVKALMSHVVQGNFKFLKTFLLDYHAALVVMRASATKLAQAEQVSASDVRGFLDSLHQSGQAALNSVVALGNNRDVMTVGQVFEILFKALGATGGIVAEAPDAPIMPERVEILREKAKAAGLKSTLGSLDAVFDELKAASQLNANFVKSLETVSKVAQSLS